MTRSRRWLRAGLVFLAAAQALVGSWAYFFPRSFFEHMPTVHLDPPFNEHFVTDTGGLYLATAVVLGAAALYMERRLICVALVSFLVYAISHLVFHVFHLEGFPFLDAVLLPSGLIFDVVFSAALLVLALRMSTGNVDAESLSAVPPDPLH
jgi:hypothetical protein